MAVQFGTIIVISTILSILYTCSFYTAMLAIVGPRRKGSNEPFLSCSCSSEDKASAEAADIASGINSPTNARHIARGLSSPSNHDLHGEYIPRASHLPPVPILKLMKSTDPLIAEGAELVETVRRSTKGKIPSSHGGIEVVNPHNPPPVKIELIRVEPETLEMEIGELLGLAKISKFHHYYLEWCIANSDFNVARDLINAIKVRHI
jgi:hypothetical protein